MDQTTLAPGALNPVLQASEQRPLVEIVETSATAGEWATPAVKKVSIGACALKFFCKMAWCARPAVGRYQRGHRRDL